jgi:chorismate dehydratase
MKNIKLGFINYINTVPVYYGILTGKVKFEGTVIKEIPGRLNRMLKEGELHVSPVSSIEYARYEKEYYLLPDFCINSNGYVRSVLLVSKYPLSELDGKKTGLTPASETSRALLKIILEEYMNFKSEYTELKIPYLKGDEQIDSALLIGDNALEFNNSEYPYHYDLAELWKKHTGLPVVFAVWAVRRDFADKYPEKVIYIKEILENSYKCGVKEPEGIINLSSSMCPASTCSYEEYFKYLGYRFEDDKQKALLHFYKKAEKMRLCNSCERLSFFNK